jgi:hypothetical protein
MDPLTRSHQGKARRRIARALDEGQLRFPDRFETEYARLNLL